MNTRRLTSALLLASTLGLSAIGQTVEEIKTLRAKAEEGDRIAQYNLGVAYTRKGEVEPNPVEAYVWLNIAQDNGARGPALETVTTQLDAAALATAQARLAEQRAKFGITSKAASPAASPKDDTLRLRAERDELSTKVTQLATEVATLRDERNRMAATAPQTSAAAQPTNGQGNPLPKGDDSIRALELFERVQQLEAQLATAKKNSSQNSPDLSGRVRELEAQLAQAQASNSSDTNDTNAVATPSSGDVEALQKKLAETEDRLATALRGYSVLQRQTAEKIDASSKSTRDIVAEKAGLETQLIEVRENLSSNQLEVRKLNSELESLRKSSSKDTTELEATKAVVKQLQGANTMLAKENYTLKARLAPNPAPTTGSIVNVSQPTPVNVEPTPAPETPQIAGTTTGRTHVVAEGDSLSKLAQRYYGDGKKWPAIYNANREKLGAENTLRVGLELWIP